MFKIGEYVTKKNYTAAALWCNQTGAQIVKVNEDGHTYYQIRQTCAPLKKPPQDLRATAYPPVGEFLDAMVKINAANKNLQQEGRAQLAAYVQACLTVKETYPKIEDLNLKEKEHDTTLQCETLCEEG